MASFRGKTKHLQLSKMCVTHLFLMHTTESWKYAWQLPFKSKICRLNHPWIFVLRECIKEHYDPNSNREIPHATTKSNTVLTNLYVYILILHSCFWDRLDQTAQLPFILKSETHSVRLILLWILWHLNQVFTNPSNRIVPINLSYQHFVSFLIILQPLLGSLVGSTNLMPTCICVKTAYTVKFSVSF